MWLGWQNLISLDLVRQNLYYLYYIMSPCGKVRMEKSVAPCHCQVLQEALPHHQLSAAAAQADGDPCQSDLKTTSTDQPSSSTEWYPGGGLPSVSWGYQQSFALFCEIRGFLNIWVSFFLRYLRWYKGWLKGMGAKRRTDPLAAPETGAQHPWPSTATSGQGVTQFG